MLTLSGVSKSFRGAVDESLDQCRALATAGVTQMTLAFQGDEPDAAMARFGDAARGA